MINFSHIYVFTVTVPSFKKSKPGYIHHIPDFTAIGHLFYWKKFYFVMVDDIEMLLKRTLLNDYEQQDYTNISEYLEVVSEWQNDINKWNNRNKDKVFTQEELLNEVYERKCMKAGIGRPKGPQRHLYPMQIFCEAGNEKKAMVEMFTNSFRHGLSEEKRKKVLNRHQEFLDKKKPMWDYIIRDPRV